MVVWEDGAISNPLPASDEAVRECERALRVRLPPDFLAVAARHQGARPLPSAFVLPGGAVTAVQHLFHFEAEPFASNIVAAGFPTEGLLQKGVIPFGAEIGGDLLCFSYRKTPDAPSVLFWSVDTGAVPLAPSFTAFVDGLVE